MRFNHKPRNPLSISYEKLEYIAAGKSGIVYGIDDERILKEYQDQESDESNVKRRAYRRLGSHPNITRYLDSLEDGSIVLERGKALRTICQRPGADQIPLHRKLRWLRHAAEGLQHVHEKGIVHADVGCGNMILTRGDCLKIIDFEGCSIDGESADSRYEWFSYRRSTPKVSIQTDIFAFACAMYEIITGRPPYHELETSDDRLGLVEQRYETDQFPDVIHLPLGELMQSCWHANFSSMSEVVRELRVSSPLSLKEEFGAAIARILKRGKAFKNGGKHPKWWVRYMIFSSFRKLT